jgi:hypothetical protein
MVTATRMSMFPKSPTAKSQPLTAIRSRRACLVPEPGPEPEQPAATRALQVREPARCQEPKVSALAGIFSFWPTLILVVDKLFSASMALTLVPNRLAIRCKVSPDFTV